MLFINYVNLSTAEYCLNWSVKKFEEYRYSSLNDGNAF